MGVGGLPKPVWTFQRWGQSLTTVQNRTTIYRMVRRIDMRDEGNGRFSQFRERAENPICNRIKVCREKTNKIQQLDVYY